MEKKHRAGERMLVVWPTAWRQEGARSGPVWLRNRLSVRKTRGMKSMDEVKALSLSRPGKHSWHEVGGKISSSGVDVFSVSGY